MPYRHALAVALVIVAGTGCTVALAGSSQTSTMLEESFRVGASATLEVDVHDADVVVETRSGADRIAVTVILETGDMERGRERYEAMNFRARLDGDRVRVESDRVRWDTWSWRDHGRFHVRVEVAAPERLDVDLVTEDGDVRVGNLEGTIRLISEDGDIATGELRGPVEIRTADGEVHVASAVGPHVSLITQDGDIVVDVIEAAEVVLETSDGDIVADVAAADRMRADTSDGDIRLRGVRGELEASTSDGDVVVDFDAPAATELSTHDGDITLTLPESAALRLDLRGEGTSFRAPSGFSGSVGRRSVRGDLNGGGPTLSARSGDGRVAIRLRDGRR